jgi:hypothetical protein
VYLKAAHALVLSSYGHSATGNHVRRNMTLGDFLPVSHSKEVWEKSTGGRTTWGHTFLTYGVQIVDRALESVSFDLNDFV